MKAMKRGLSFLLIFVTLLILFPRLISKAAETGGMNYTGGTGSRLLPSYENKENVVLLENEGNTADYQCHISEENDYILSFSYFGITSKKADIEISISVNGVRTGTYVLKRQFKDAAPISKDSRGNDVLPDSEEVFAWQVGRLYNRDISADREQIFHLQPGINKITITLLQEKVALAECGMQLPKKILPYSEYAARYHNELNANSGVEIKIQGEDYNLRSDENITASTDRGSPSVEPSDAEHIRLNTLGGNNWNSFGSWVEWKVDIKKPGFYKLNFKAKQNIVRSMYSHRRLYIDGNVPFSEAAELRFPFASSWYNQGVEADNKPALIYLDKGPHDIRLECIYGQISDSIDEIQDIIQSISEIYRSIIRITGTTPDPYREYGIEDQVPGILTKMQDVAVRLKQQAGAFEQYTGKEGGDSAQLLRIASMFENMAAKPYTITAGLDRIRNENSFIAAWLLTLKQQPLEIDYISLLAENEKPQKATANIWDSFVYAAKSFLASFTSDYMQQENSKDAISVWAYAGEEPVNIMRRLSDSVFTENTGNKVDIRLVTTSTNLIQVILAGKAPDVVLNMGKTLPVDLALRGAVADLSTLGDVSEIEKEFYPSAFIPYRLNGGTYALPETQSFMMFFYRTDIFEELGIAAPKTWDDFYGVLKIVEENNMDIGIPGEYNFSGVSGVNEQVFQMLLFQRGLSYYGPDTQVTQFDRPEVLDVFIQWTDLFTKYGVPLYYDFFNRFQTGEIPCGLADISTYNLLNIAAPQIRGKWKMTMVPGTANENGQIDHSIGSDGTCCVILSGSKKQKEAFDFIKWWVSSETQSAYGSRVESQMGMAARYLTANKVAFEKLPWTQSQIDLISSQWRFVKDVPQYPGSYYISRSLSNAFRKVVYQNANKRETLFDYNDKIIEEMTRKRKEFGIQ